MGYDVGELFQVGIRSGEFTLEAASPFSPIILRDRGQLDPSNPNRSGIVLRFPDETVTNGTISGTVFLADGVTPASAGTEVAISFGDLNDTESDVSQRGREPRAYAVLAELNVKPGVTYLANVRNRPEGSTGESHE